MAFGVQLLCEIPHRRGTRGHQRRDDAARGARDVLNPRQLLGLVEAVGDELHGAEVEPLERAADGLHFLRRRPRAWHQVARAVHVPVEARGGEPKCPRLERRAGQGAHLDHVLGRRIVVTAFAHDIEPHGHVRHLRPHVHRVGGVDAVEVVGERLPTPGNAVVQCGAGDVLHALHEFHQPVLAARSHRGETDAAVAHDDRGHAVPARRRDMLVPADLAVVVSVDVDEAGGQEVALGVDDAPRLGRAGSGRRDVRDLAFVDYNVAAPRRSACAVHDGCVADDQIVHAQSPSETGLCKSCHHSQSGGLPGGCAVERRWLLAEVVSESEPEGQQLRSNCRRAL